VLTPFVGVSRRDPSPSPGPGRSPKREAPPPPAAPCVLDALRFWCSVFISVRSPWPPGRPRVLQLQPEPEDRSKEQLSGKTPMSAGVSAIIPPPPQGPLLLSWGLEVVVAPGPSTAPS
jgi:hypothetical protein